MLPQPNNQKRLASFLLVASGQNSRALGLLRVPLISRQVTIPFLYVKIHQLYVLQ